MKQRKEDVDYGKGMVKSHCGPIFKDDRGFCRHYIQRMHHGTCELVEGEIHPTMWCKLFERAAAKSS